jgi:hypothetical protein
VRRCISLPAELDNWLKETAYKERVTSSQVVVRLIKSGLGSEPAHRKTSAVIAKTDLEAGQVEPTSSERSPMITFAADYEADFFVIQEWPDLDDVTTLALAKFCFANSGKFGSSAELVEAFNASLEA